MLGPCLTCGGPIGVADTSGSAQLLTVRFAFGILLAALTLGCGQLTGVSDLHVEDDDAGGGVTDPLADRFGGSNYDAVACNSCIAENCPDDLATCEVDPSCVTYLSCWESCDNPACLLDCWDGKPFAEGSGPQRSCTPCRDECSIGAEWECADRFSWPSVEQQTGITIYVDNAVNQTPVSGARVRACLTVDPDCLSAEAEAVTDDEGFATLSVPSTALTGRGFSGHYLVEAEGFTTVLRYPSMPAYDGRYVRVNMVQVGITNAYLVMMGVDVSPDQGSAWFVISDCRGSPSRQVDVSFSPGGDDLVIAYPQLDSTIVLDPAQSVGFLSLPSVTPGFMTATMHLDGEYIGDSQFAVRAGSVTQVDLLPFGSE